MNAPKQQSLFTTASSTPTKTDKQGYNQTLQSIRVMSQVLDYEPGFMLFCVVLLQQSGLLKAEQIHYFSGPVIFRKTDWSLTLPDKMVDRLIQAVRIERFSQLLDEAELGHSTLNCTPAEVVCALQPYSLCAPLPHHYADALIWSFARMVEWHPKLFGEMNLEFGTTDSYLREPEPYILQELGIRRKVIARANKALSTRSKSTQSEPKSTESTQTFEQFSLFD